MSERSFLCQGEDRVRHRAIKTEGKEVRARWMRDRALPVNHSWIFLRWREQRRMQQV